eukprot:7216316-Pyramimonas_sp.AAC.1
MTNNTAELTAAIEMGLWLLGLHLPSGAASIPKGSTLEVIFDSTYVLRILEYKFRPQHNVVLAILLQTVWAAVKRDFVIFYSWVKGHSERRGNT